MIYPSSFEQKTGFDRIRVMIIESCLCDLGRERAEEMRFMTDFKTIQSELQITSELKAVLEMEEHFPQDGYLDARKSILKARIEGAFPEVVDLVLIRKSLAVIIQISRFFADTERRSKYPLLYQLSSQVETFPAIIKEINRLVDDTGKIKDNASPELQDIRSTLRQKQTEVNRKLISILKQAKAEGLVEEDADITFRNERPVIPILAAGKRRLGGMIHDESATGKTAFVEPAAIVELNNRVRELLLAESREIKRILLAFADFLRPEIENLLASYDFLATIDFLRAKARFARQIKACLPVLNNEQAFRWKQAVHPILYLTHSAEDKPIVPLDIYLTAENRILVISGPNAGGKSVCLKTVGLMQYMLQCGLLVPVSPNSEAGVFESIFIDIGDEQSIDNDLSTYSGHLENMKFFVKHANKSTLLLIDEFGTGTEPNLGGAIAEAVLEKLQKQEVFGVITTHYANLKHFASQTPGIANGAMLFDSQSIKPLYQLSIGKPGSSFAIDIARKIGLPEDILQSASSKIGEEHFNYDKQLREIARDKRYWEEKRQRIRKVEKTLDELYGRYGGELENIQRERRRIISEAKEEAKLLLKEANASIERTIRDIKEAQAEKEQTRLVRERFESDRAALDKKSSEAADPFTKKQEELRKAERLLVERSTELKETSLKKIKPQKDPVLQPGDKVKLQGMDSEGEVIKTEGKYITVAFGNMISTVHADKIVRGNESEEKSVKNAVKTRLSPELQARRFSFKPDIDVRGLRAEAALMQIQQFLDGAIMSGAHQLSILHGKGNGILRQLIREYLLASGYVKSCTDAHADRGGAGITEVVLEY